MVLRTMISMRAARADEKGMVRPRAKGCLDVVVGPDSIDRAMRLLASLIRGLDRRSYQVSVKDGEKPATFVEIDGESIPFRFEERAARKERRGDNRQSSRFSHFFRPKVVYDYFPSGELTLHIGISVPLMTRHSWRDGGKKRVEDWLNSFVVGLIRTSQGIKAERVEAERRRVEAERRRREWDESERRRQEAERLRKEEEERIRRVETTLDEWIKFRALRDMIAEVRSRAADFGEEIPTESHLGRWPAVAERRLRKLDPIDPMLTELQPPEIGSSTNDGGPIPSLVVW